MEITDGMLDIVATLRKIVENGCEYDDDSGGTNCFFCHAFIGADEPHRADYPFIAAKRLFKDDNH